MLAKWPIRCLFLHLFKTKTPLLKYLNGVFLFYFFTFALAGKLSDSFVRLLEQRLLKWQDSFKA